MSLALYINSVGSLEQIAAGETLDIDIIEPASAGHLVIGATLGTGEELRLGAAGAAGDGDVRVMGDFYVDGSSTISVDETVTGNFAVDGNTDLGAAGGDTINLGASGFTNDIINLNSDLLPKTGGAVGIGNVTNYLNDLWIEDVAGASAAAVDLRATGSGVAGAHGVGVYTGGMTISPATDDLQTVLVAMDAAISAGGGESLQQTYAIGNTIAVTTANGALQFSNTADVTNVLELSRTFAGAGVALSVNMGASTTGIGMDIDSVAGAAGNLIDIANAGDGIGINMVNSGGGVGFFLNNTSTTDNAMQVQDGGTDVFVIDQTGAISMTAQQASTFSTAAGNLTLDAIAGELVLDDVGSASLTLSQSSYRSLSQTGAGEILNGATSLVGAINRIADEIQDVGVDQFVTVDIPAGTTTTVGSPMSYSAVSGEVILADSDVVASQKLAGIAREAAAGPATITMWTPGALCTDAGASHTVGDPLFISETAGDLTQTVPTTAGSLVQRVGWSLTATNFVYDPGPPVIL